MKVNNTHYTGEAAGEQRLLLTQKKEIKQDFYPSANAAQNRQTGENIEFLVWRIKVVLDVIRAQ